MELSQVEELAVLLREHPISEIEVSRPGGRIHLKKGAAVATAAAPTAVSTAGASTMADDLDEFAAKFVDTSILLASEMVGLFHHANPPIRVGSTVKEGQTVGSVESMKLMNDVRSAINGQIVEVLIEEGEPVDYGRQLFRIVPTG